MTFIRRYGFSRASRTILLILLPFLGIALLGANAVLRQGLEVNPGAKYFLIGLFDFLLSGALVGLISGAIGGIQADDEPGMGKICTLVHGVLILLMVGLIALLLQR